MKVFYRCYSGMSVNPNPLGTIKREIFDRCLRSYLAAGEVDTTFVADRIPEDWWGFLVTLR